MEAKTGVPAESHRLIFAGRELDDARTIDDYNLLNGTTVYMIARPSTAADDRASYQVGPVLMVS